MQLIIPHLEHNNWRINHGGVGPIFVQFMLEVNNSGHNRLPMLTTGIVSNRTRGTGRIKRRTEHGLESGPAIASFETNGNCLHRRSV
jgi:hypothetical protein